MRALVCAYGVIGSRVFYLISRHIRIFVLPSAVVPSIRTTSFRKLHLSVPSRSSAGGSRRRKSRREQQGNIWKSVASFVLPRLGWHRSLSTHYSFELVVSGSKSREK